MQRRNDLDAELAHHDRLIELEATFVKVVGSWAARTGIGPAALLEVGVPADVLQRAGLTERQT